MFKLCRYVKEEGFETKGELIKVFGSAFKEARDLNYIEEDTGKFVITNKGLAYLDQFKVDNAIIVASGFGSRFIPFTYDVPHGLLVVRGEPLVERQIKQLKNVGIDDITVVVGYLGQQFDYLIDKFDVSIVKNPSFKERDLLSGLRLIKDRLANTYIISADIYLGDRVVHENEKNSWYGAMFNQSLATSSYPNINENNEFIGIKNREPRHQWILKGPIFLDKEASRIVRESVDKPFKDFNDLFNHILQFTKVDLLAVKAHDVFVLDTIESLRAFDRRYLSPGNHEILDLIGHIFKVKQDEIYDISMMKEGMTNDSFLFTVNNKRYVFRVPGAGTDLLISRSEEALVYNLIKELDISDEIVYFDPLSGFKITRFYENIRTLNNKNVEEVEKAVQVIRMLHEKDLHVNHAFDLEERITFYKKLCDDSKANYYDGFDNIFKDIKKVIAYIKSFDRPLTLCHIDANEDNFLVLEDGTLRLIDWEYAGMSDPLVDIAMYVLYAEYNQEQIDNTFNLYTKNQGSDVEKAIYYGFIALSGFVWALWTIYKEALGDEFDDYGKIQLRYAKEYSEKTLAMKDSFNEH